jgi:hypothetical protein
LEEIILVNGNNNYNIPHIGKAALEWAGVLPDRLAAGEGAIELASTFLDYLFNSVGCIDKDVFVSGAILHGCIGSKDVPPYIYTS